MAYVVDYAADYAHVDGVEAASYAPLSGDAVTGVKVRRGSLSRLERSGSVLGVAPSDVPFVVWLSTLGGATLDQEAILTVGAVAYTVLSFVSRPDGAQARLICRKRL